jgi:PAS domain S-box-containing protein
VEASADYLPRHALALLAPAVKRAAEFRRLREEHRNAQDALCAAEERCSLLFEANPSPMFIFDEGTLAFLDVNAAAVAHYGWAREEFLSMTLRDIWPPEDVPALLTHLAGKERGLQGAHHWRHRKKSGEIIHVEVTTHTLIYAGRQAQLSLVLDVSERRKVSRELQQQKARLDDLLFQVPCVVWEMRGTPDEAGSAHMEFLSHHAEEMLGYPMEMWLTEPDFLMRVLHPQDRERTLRWITSIFAGRPQPVGEMRLLANDGRVVWVESQAALIRDELGRPAGARGVTLNVTGRKNRERQLREQARMLDLAQDAIGVHDLADRVQFWNRGGERVFGWNAEEAVGADVRDLLGVDREAFARAKAAVLADGDWHGELALRSKAGKPVIVSARWTLVRDEHGEPKSVLAIKTDITEQKNLEARFLRAQRLESIGTLASGVAHDLNNILSPILMSAPLLREPLPADALEMLVSTIETSAQRGASIVKQVLTFARGVEGERMPLQPKHLLCEMERIAFETFPKSIGISNSVSPDLWLVEGDATQLHQVLLNLCVNARDAMPEGGRLKISAENFHVDEHYAAMLPGAKPGRYVQLAVADTGTGIPVEILDQIFDPFFTTKEPGKGTGLGLSTVMGITKSHGGFVNVYSEPGKGTTFRVFLPAMADGSTPVAQSEPDEVLRGNGERILVVDDESGLRIVTDAILTKHGYKVTLASDGAEAIAIYAREGHDLSAVLTDVVMPVLDGVALTRALRRLNPQVRIIASTGQGEDSRKDELRSLGVAAFLTKPYDTPKLLRTVHGVLRGRTEEG